jgi:Na+/H+ antiporter NhaD/arsenite permease-like protein
MSATLSTAVVVVFAITYGLIASRRLGLLPVGRPAFALIGAVAMVGLGALTPKQAYAAIDSDTITLLLGMMLLSVYFEDAGLLDRMAGFTLRRCRTAAGLLVVVSVVSAVLSAVLVNDTVCLFFTPMVVAVCRRAALPMGPYLIALATSSNIGSAATLVGNPQNMIIAGRSQLGFLEFFALAGPLAAAALLLNIALLFVYYGKDLRGLTVGETPSSASQKLGLPSPRLATAVFVGVIVGFCLGWHLGLVAMGGAAVLILAGRRDPAPVFARVDWPLLVFFCGLFIVVAAFLETGLVGRAWTAVLPYVDLSTASGLTVFAAVIALGSNLVSNVPMTIIAAPLVPELGGGSASWVLLAYVATVAGNFTLLGSVANIIVAERARPHYELGYREYLRFGAVSTIATLVLGVGLLVITT